jgi:SNW domain-containing protein 1
VLFSNSFADHSKLVLYLSSPQGNMRKNKVDRDEGRDISEKIALGMLKGTGKLTGESMYDSRLFNQSSGMDAGFGAEDEYTTYSKPLFERAEAANTIYRPKNDAGDVYGDVDTQLNKLSDTSRFRPDKGFKGADAVSGGAGPRDAPVQFEKAKEPRESRSSRDDHRSSRRDHDDRDDDRRSSSRRDHSRERGGGGSSSRGDSSRYQDDEDREGKRQRRDRD